MLNRYRYPWKARAKRGEPEGFLEHVGAGARLHVRMSERGGEEYPAPVAHLNALAQALNIALRVLGEVDDPRAHAERAERFRRALRAVEYAATETLPDGTTRAVCPGCGIPKPTHSIHFPECPIGSAFGSRIEYLPPGSSSPFPFSYQS